MKKIFLSIISITFLCTFLLADQASLAVQKLLYGRASYSLEEQISIEKYELNRLEEELAYYQNILNLKTAIQKLYSLGNIEEIEQRFSHRSEQFNDLLQDDFLKESQLSVNEQKIIFEGIAEIKDQLLLNEARLYYRQNKIESARKILEEIVSDYQSSPSWQPAYELLTKLCFEHHDDEKLIDLIENYEIEKTELLAFQYANALYNLGKYDQAETEFEQLVDSQSYGHKSQSILAIINYLSGDSKTATEQLKLLLKEKDVPTSVTNFALLNLGRIYLLQESEQAWPYFEEYYHNNSVLDDEILYEIARYFFFAGKYDQAKVLLSEIVEQTPKSRFYVSANFMLTITNYNPTEQENMEMAVDSLIAANQELLDNLNSKLYFLEKFEKIQEQLVNIDTLDTTYENLSHQLNLIELELDEIDNQLSKFYQGSSLQNLRKLSFLEEEYKNYAGLLAEIRALILIAKQMPKQNFSTYLDKQMTLNDSSLITLHVVKYLQAKPVISPQDFQLARSLALEKVLLQSELEEWQNLKDTASQNMELLAKIEAYESLLQANLDSFDTIADYIFYYSQAPNSEQYLNDEILAIQENRSELRRLQKNIGDSFDNLISQKLQRESESLLAEFSRLKADYYSLIDAFALDITKENKEYEYEILDLLYRNVQELDAKYQELQQKRQSAASNPLPEEDENE